MTIKIQRITTSAILLTLFVAASALADDVNQRQHASPEVKAKVNRQLANAYAQGGPVDRVTVTRGEDASAVLEIGTVNGTGHALREQNIVTGDNTVICLHCRSR